MEGVLISAKKEGSKVTVTVVSDREGRYTFPAERLEPGNYHLRIRAVGYELEDPGVLNVEAKKTLRRDLTLQKATDLASQLTAAEWLMSAPGTPDQKMKFGAFCIQCHSLEIIFRSKYNADGFLTLFDRMENYSPASLNEPGVLRAIPNPSKIPLRPGDKELAEYLSSINLSSSKDGKWPFQLKTLPRPTGRATKVIITEYDLPRRECQPHDVIVNREGIAWYSDIGGGYLGRLDPRTDDIKEWKTPRLIPGAPEGSLDIGLDKDGNPWLAMRQQGAIGRFEKKTEKFTTWSLPPEDGSTPDATMLALNPDGTVWLKGPRSPKAYKLDPRTGQMVSFATASDNYGMASDSQGNLYQLSLNHHVIGEVDAKSGKSTTYPVPTPMSGPRRGRIDSQGRFWFGFYYAGLMGMFDTKTKQFKEWPLSPVPESSPYYAMIDNNGEAWAGSELTDIAYRLNPTTGEVTSYLLPALEANIQRIDVDSSTTPVTVWIGEAHQAKIAKIEPLD